MRDEFGREISYLRLSVTDLCNFRCRYCMPEEGVVKRGHKDILSVEEIIEISRACVALGIRKIRITGGEPLVRKGIVEICRGIAEIPGMEELCLTTNGSLLPQYAGELRKAGVDRLNISIDSLEPDRFADITRRGTLGDVLEGLAASRKAGFKKIKLNVVLMGGINDGEIPDFVELTRYEPIEVRFIELMPMGECAGWDSSRFISAEAVTQACPGLRKIEGDGVAERYRIDGYAGTVGLIRPVSHAFCPICNRIRVTADGMLKPCLHSSSEIPLRGLHGKDLEDAILRGIRLKPMRHHLECGTSDAKRGMNRIGG